jgi:hypothetical protein
MQDRKSITINKKDPGTLFRAKLAGGVNRKFKKMENF